MDKANDTMTPLVSAADIVPTTKHGVEAMDDPCAKSLNKRIEVQDMVD